MSRTYKDKKWSLRFPEETDPPFGTERIVYEVQCKNLNTGEKLDKYWTNYWYRDLPGAKTKKPRYLYTHWNWCRNTSSWWTKMTCHVPKRAKCRNWEKTRTLDNLDEPCPDYGRKPHIYYH
jgi:hypothetical protein